MSDQNFGWANALAAEYGPSGDPEEGEGDEEQKKVSCEYRTGAAGTGKTFSIKEEIARDPQQGILCATTGIAGVNLGATTIHSVLRYFDTDSLQQAFITGRLTRRLAELALQYKRIYLDESSMLPAEQLDTFYQALLQTNSLQKIKKSKFNPEGLGLTLTGDFCQLPPIKAKWAFEAECWPEFEANTTILTKNWRQGDGKFLNAINQLRAGMGPAGAQSLSEAGIEFASANLLDFPGTTILAKNLDVDRFNWVALSKVPGETIKVTSERWVHESARPGSEWKLIPEELVVKKGAYVMILANDSPAFTYANGDCGFIEDYDPNMRCFQIKLVRNDRIVWVPVIERRIYTKYDPITVVDSNDATSLTFSKRQERDGEPRPWRVPYLDIDNDMYVAGGVRYSPIRLAYAATVHKTQGLTLDRVQMDVRNAFFSSPAMIYVAVSRCRTAAGLRVVGSPQLLGTRCKIAEEVRRWL